MRHWRAHAVRRCVLLCAAAALVSAPCLAAQSASGAPATIGDLSSQPVAVRKQPAKVSGSAQAMENYRQFLEMQNADANLRAEALRRLGDLSLESGDLELSLIHI